MRPTVNAVGNLTKTPILEQTKNGVPVVRFTVACNAAKDEPATFLWCVAYNKKAETIVKYFEKGSPIAVVGELRQYSDEKGAAHFVCDVFNFGFVASSRRNDPSPQNEKRTQTQSHATKNDQNDDVPF